MSTYAVVDPATGETIKEYPTISDDDLREFLVRRKREMESDIDAFDRTRLRCRAQNHGSPALSGYWELRK